MSLSAGIRNNLTDTDLFKCVNETQNKKRSRIKSTTDDVIAPIRPKTTARHCLHC